MAMHRFELAIAAVFGALFTAFYVVPGAWSEPTSVRLIAGSFVLATVVFYLYAVEDNRRVKVGAWHRIAVGGAAGAVIAAISQGGGELYVLLSLIGAMLGYVGFRWLKHVPL